VTAEQAAEEQRQPEAAAERHHQAHAEAQHLRAPGTRQLGLDVRLGDVEQVAEGHVLGAHGLAGAAGQAMIQALLEFVIHLAGGVHLAHQLDATARTFLILVEQAEGRTPDHALAAVDALVKQLLRLDAERRVGKLRGQLEINVGHVCSVIVR